MAISPKRKRYLLAGGAIAIALAASASSGVALARDSSGTTPPPAVAASCGDAGGLNEEFHAALQALVADGTITQTQANTIREQGDTGSIDPRELVRDGVVSAAQMRTVADRLGDVKRNFARRLDESADTSPSPAVPKSGQ
jgi:hypothetical protein